ncbi:MAG: DUF4097 family beta strand repeat protein [Clostridia bacterium]|nr:DUF4097 family beta strand repeat protein [Clostridia bacterium]
MKLRKILNSTLIAGAVVLLVGVVVFTIAFATTGFNLTSFSYVNVEEKTYVETETTTELSLSAHVANVYLYEAKPGQPLSVKYTRRKSREGDLLNDVEIHNEGSALVLTEREYSDGRPFLLDVTNPQITIYFPTDRTFDIEVYIDEGNIRVDGSHHMDTVVLNTKKGSLYTEKSKITCDVLSLTSMSGGINFGEASADQVTASATNGSVSINGNVTARQFSASADNGQIYYRSSVIDADEITLKSTRGNIKAKLRGKKEDFLTDVTVESGRSNLSDRDTGDKVLNVSVSGGTIHIDFEEE